jgi:hypothetical protein
MDMITKVISGCQTGADHTGLTVAKEFGIDTGGWCPPRCATENGDRPEFIAYFGLKETIQHGYKPRTILNVRDSDGTVWFGHTTSPGYLCTKSGVDIRPKRPFITNPTPQELVDWILKFNIKVLNTAGNRASVNPAVIVLTRTTLVEAFRRLKVGTANNNECMAPTNPPIEVNSVCP